MCFECLSSGSKATLEEAHCDCGAVSPFGHGLPARLCRRFRYPSSFVGTPDLLFGDINESLPNGYRLHALDKMPEAGSIQKGNDSLAYVAWVGELQTVGSTVLGKYDYTYFPKAKGEDDRNFFSFDTQAGKVQIFATQAELSVATGIVPHLTPTAYFHGSKTVLQRISTYALLFVAFLPPATVALWLLWRLRESLKSEPDAPAHA
jgi:hypothetical protein